MKKNFLMGLSVFALFMLAVPQVKAALTELPAASQDLLHVDDCPSWADGCGGNPKPNPKPDPEPKPEPRPDPKPEPQPGPKPVG